MMRRFFLWLVVFAVALYGFGSALDIDKAEAGKMVWVKCATKSRAVPYPHFNGTRVRCFAPRFWIPVAYKFAIRIGTYPILLDRAWSNRVCVNGKPKVVQTVDKDGGVSSSWRPRKRICVRMEIR